MGKAVALIATVIGLAAPPAADAFSIRYPRVYSGINYVTASVTTCSDAPGRFRVNPTFYYPSSFRIRRAAVGPLQYKPAGCHRRGVRVPKRLDPASGGFWDLPSGATFDVVIRVVADGGETRSSPRLTLYVS